MISISDELREAIDSDARTIRTLIYFDDRTEPLIDGIISVTLTEQGFAGQGLSLGEFNTNQLKVSMYIEEADDLTIDENTTVRAVQQIMVDEETEAYEDIPIGTFYIYSIERSDDTDKLEFTAYDVSYKLSTETYAPGKDVDFPTDSDTVFRDIMNQYGIDYVESSYEGKKVPFEDYYQATCMNYIQYIAQFQNSNVRINRDAKLEFYWWKDSGYNIGRSKQTMGAFKRTSDVDFVVKGVNGGTTTVTTYVPIEYEDDDEYEEEYEVVEEEEPLAIGSSTNCVSFSNPFMTMDLLQPIYDFLVDFTYTACTVGYRGNPALELGDIVHVEDSKGELHDVLLSMHTIVLTGMKGDISCTDNQGVAETMSQQTPTDAKISAVVESIQRAYIKQADIEKLYVQKGEIDNLDAKYATIESLEATNARIDSLDVDSLRAQVAVIENSYITNADVQNLLANYATVHELEAKYATISDLEATNARIDSLDVTKLEARVAEIEEAYISRAEVGDLLANYITADTIEANYIRVDLANFTTAMVGQLLADSGLVTNMTIQNGYVTGMLNSVTINADVITAGTLSVDRLLITGEDGIIYEINMESSGLSASELTDDVYKNYINGTVIVANSITASQIAAGTITATEIAANTITADKLTISELSAISGDLGSITAGSIDIGNGNFIVDSAGNLYAQSATIYGSIYAEYGEIGGFTINEKSLESYYDDIYFILDTANQEINMSQDSTDISRGIEIKVNEIYMSEALSNSQDYIELTADGLYITRLNWITGSAGLGRTTIQLSFKGLSLTLAEVESYIAESGLYYKNGYGVFSLGGEDGSIALDLCPSGNGSVSNYFRIYDSYATTDGDIFIGDKTKYIRNFKDLGVSIRSEGYICITRDGNAGIYMEYGTDGNANYNGRCITASSYMELSYGSTKGTITNYIRLCASRTDIYTATIVSSNGKSSTYGYDGCYIGTNGRIYLSGYYSNEQMPGTYYEVINSGAWWGYVGMSGSPSSSYLSVQYADGGYTSSADNYIRLYSDNTRLRRTCYIGNNRSANYTATGITLNINGYIELTRSGTAAVYLSSSTGSSWQAAIRVTTSSYMDIAYCGTTRGTISNYVRLYSDHICIPTDVYFGTDTERAVTINSSNAVVIGSSNNTGGTVLCSGDGQYMRLRPSSRCFVYRYDTDLSTSNTGQVFTVSTTSSYTADGTSNSNIVFTCGVDGTSSYMRSYATYARTTSNTANVYITSSGTFARYQSSSQRYKNHINYFTNIEYASEEALDKSTKNISYDDFRDDMRSILKLPVVEFHYNEGYILEGNYDYSSYEVGFIAEDVYKDVPSAVDFNEDGTIETWNINKLFPRAVFVLQEHDNDIDILKKKVNALECECDVLHCENDRLQAQIEELLDK